MRKAALALCAFSLAFATPAVAGAPHVHRLRAVRKDLKLTWPRAETATDYIAMATDLDLAVATRTAIQEMIDFLVAAKGLDKRSAYQLTSIAGNVAITELVDSTLGVHVKMPKSIFRQGAVGRKGPR